MPDITNDDITKIKIKNLLLKTLISRLPNVGRFIPKKTKYRTLMTIPHA